MGGYGQWVLDLALSNPGASTELRDVSLCPAGECRSHEKVARQEDSEGNDQPLEAYENNGVYLEGVAIPHCLKKSSCSHSYDSVSFLISEFIRLQNIE